MSKKEILLKLFQSKKIKACPYCNKESNIRRINTKYNRVYFNCEHYVNPLKGTIMAKTRISILKWWNLFKVYAESPLTSKQASKILGISIMGAWKILNKIRKNIPFVEFAKGEILQFDEMLLGSRKRWSKMQKMSAEEIEKYNAAKGKDGKPSRHRKDLSDKKTLVFGIASESGKYLLYDSKIKAMTMAKIRNKQRFADTWNHLIDKHCNQNIVHHDGNRQLAKIIADKNMSSDFVNHSKHEYVKVSNMKIVTTNRIEGMFGRFKRAFKGIHTHSKNRLQGYLNEAAWRNSNKHNKHQKLLKLLYLI